MSNRTPVNDAPVKPHAAGRPDDEDVPSTLDEDWLEDQAKGGVAVDFFPFDDVHGSSEVDFSK